MAYSFYYLKKASFILGVVSEKVSVPPVYLVCFNFTYGEVKRANRKKKLFLRFALLIIIKMWFLDCSDHQLPLSLPWESHLAHAGFFPELAL
jgi:Cu/Ag efflux pump CusA